MVPIHSASSEASPLSEEVIMRIWIVALVAFLAVPAHGVLAQQVSPNGVKTLSPEGAIKPTGTWNLGTRAGDFIFVAGMRGIDAKTNSLVQGDEARVRQAFSTDRRVGRRRPARLGAAGGLRHRHVPVPAAGEQGAGGAVGQGSVSAAHHH